MKPRLEIEAPADQPIIVTRRWFKAPPELVWQAWTRPELLRRWMGPRTLECLSYDVDLRVGGGWRMVHRGPDGDEYGFHGEYREISAPHRLVGTFVFELMPEHVAVDTLTLEAKDGGTLATTHTVHSSIAARDGHLQSGMEGGMSDGYARLDDLAAEGATATQGLMTCLWFRSEAEEAVNHYLEVFGEGRIVHTTRMGPGGPVVSTSVELAGQRLVALNGRREGAFTEASSLVVPCQSQAQVDKLWDGFIAGGGTASMCGWLKDRYGVSWQIVPHALFELLGHPDPVAAGRVAQAMMAMQKIEVAPLLKAAQG